MRLEDVFQDLRDGELRNHPWSIDDEFTETAKRKIVGSMNVALTDIYTRFPLLQRELTVIQHSGTTQYHLLQKYAQTSGSAEPIKYIYDTVENPFKGNVLRIESVFDEAGDELTLNSDAQCKVAFTPAPDILEVPNPTDTNALFVIYRTRPDVITLEKEELDVPETMRGLLLAYVAYRAYAGSSDQQQVAMSMTNFQKYEMLCQQLMHIGMVNDHNDNLPNCKPSRGGWI